MAYQNQIYTGYLTYKAIDFSFVFEGKELRLIPPMDKRYEVADNWLRTPKENGAFVPNFPIMEADYLCGICNENDQKMIFFVKSGSYLSTRGNCFLGGNYVLTINVIAFILCKYGREKINQISFTNPEISAIHPLRKAFSVTLSNSIESFSNSGVLSVTTKDFASTTTQSQEFFVDDKKATAHFSVWRSVNWGDIEPPISLNSSLTFEFDPTDDYNFVLKLWYIAKNFLAFLCYRKDVYFPEAKLAAPCEDGQHEQFATLYVVSEKNSSNIEDTIKKGRYIKQELIAGHEGQILTDIAANRLYLRHIPESYDSGRHKDAAKFILLTSAFEWEFKRLYPDGVARSEATAAAEKVVMEAIGKLFQSSTGKVRKIYRYLKRQIKNDPLQAEVVQVGTDLAEIIDLFGKYLYSMNGEKVVYSEIGKRIGDQRNHFAHGDLDKDFIDLSLLDLIFLERIVYAMQLKYYGIETPKIQNAINDLFHSGIALPQG